MLLPYQYWVDVVKYFFIFSKTRLSERFESYYINWFYEVTFEPLRQTGFRKIEKVFDYINSELIRQQHIKRMGVRKKLTHPNVRKALKSSSVYSDLFIEVAFCRCRVPVYAVYARAYTDFWKLSSKNAIKCENGDLGVNFWPF